MENNLTIVVKYTRDRDILINELMIKVQMERGNSNAQLCTVLV